MKKNKQKINLLVTLFVFLAIGHPIISNAATILIASEDSGVLDGDTRNNPFPGILYSELDTLGDGNIWLSVLKFDLSPIEGMSINSASFELTSISNHNSGSFVHEIFSSSDDSWAEETVSGTNRPSDSTLSFLDSTDITGTSQIYSWDVLDGVIGTDGIGGTNNFLTLLIRPELSQAGYGVFGPHFNDREDLSGFPRLLIDVDVNQNPAPAPNPVPVPAAIWLFGSGLISFLGMRKNKARIAIVKT
jgi:hypothetical protein